VAKKLDIMFPGGRRIDVMIGERTVRTDQSVEHGGEGSAPAPFDLFLSSIAACAGIYAQDFCQARSISTEGMKGTMSCEFDPAEKRYTKMTIDLTLPEGFPEKYVPAIVRAMNLCSVKKHITNAPEFVIRAA
jgi:ribosomal protein S12 methylthiotransferase accessory factor